MDVLLADCSEGIYKLLVCLLWMTCSQPSTLSFLCSNQLVFTPRFEFVKCWNFGNCYYSLDSYWRELAVVMQSLKLLIVSQDRKKTKHPHFKWNTRYIIKNLDRKLRFLSGQVSNFIATFYTNLVMTIAPILLKHFQSNQRLKTSVTSF